MSQPARVQPPRLAPWLIGLFSEDHQAEAITGDLLEEYTGLIATTGPTAARRWYWRQTVKSIAHLLGNQFRLAPWSIVITVLAGYFLLGRVTNGIDRVATAFLARHNVYPYVNAYVVGLIYGELIDHPLNINRRGLHIAMAKFDEHRAEEGKRQTTGPSVAHTLHTDELPTVAVVHDPPGLISSKTTVQ